jgi:hypothetical protein
VLADMAGGASATRAANLEASGEMLRTFQKRVNTLLTDFEGSAGSSAKVGSQTISPASLSSGNSFGEADDLYAQYRNVHGHLISLSKTLGLQIEGIGIAVKGAKNGFANLEEELRHRFWQIQAEIEQERQGQQQDQRTNEAKDGGAL